MLFFDIKKTLFTLFVIVVVIYALVCGLLYFYQEKIIFYPEKLDKRHEFRFNQKFEEKNIELKDGAVLNGLLFKAENSKGVIFYLHGNAGSLDSWGLVAKRYTDLNYDVFLLDYRGYGKSGGKISGQNQIYEDIQTAYNEIKKIYKEDTIIVLGYSIGTGLASKIASTNNPKLLILQAPYYSLSDMMRHNFPIIPTFILKYKFEVHSDLKKCKMPVVIFHGTEDEIIYTGSSIKLKEEFKERDRLILLEGQGHNGMSENEEYNDEIRRVLSR